MAARPKQGQGASRTNPTKKALEPWQSSMSELQNISFDYGVQMKPALFKSNVSEIELLLRELLKYDDPKVNETIRSGVGPTLVKPVKPELKTVEGVEQTEIDTIEEMEIYKYEIPQVLQR